MKIRLFIAGIIGAILCMVAAPLMVFAADEPAELYAIAEAYLTGDPDAFELTERTVITDGAGIYRDMADVDPADTADIGCTFDALAEIGEWVLIVTNDSVAYVHSADLARLYSDEDLDILAHVICGECQCYPDEEQLYVGSVVLNRVADGRYPNTIHDVVFQRGQYACTWDGNYYRTPTERNWANARYLLEHGSVLPVEVVYQSGGRQGKGVYVHTKYHYYCY